MTFRNPAVRAGAEVSVGAYARRQRVRRFLVGAVGVSLLLAAGAIYLALSPSSAPQRGRYDARVVCISCGFRGTIQVDAQQTFPMICQTCGEKGCRQLWRCNACGHEFPAEPGSEPVRCTKCASVSVGSAVGHPQSAPTPP